MEQIRNIIEPISEKLAGVSQDELNSLKDVMFCFPAIQKIILYGSRVSGGYSEKSDLDVYWEITEKTKGQISDMKNRAQQMLSSKIKYPIHIKDSGEVNNQQLLWNIKNAGVELQ